MYKILIFISIICIISCKDHSYGSIELRVDDVDFLGNSKNGNSNNDYASVHSIIDTGLGAIHPYFSDQIKAENSKSIYVLNKSFDQIFEFTIRKIETKNDSIISNTTLKVELSPGDEKWLGTSYYHNLMEYEDQAIPTTVLDTIKIIYEVVGQKHKK